MHICCHTGMVTAEALLLPDLRISAIARATIGFEHFIAMSFMLAFCKTF
jgi:hypothetical protein